MSDRSLVGKHTPGPWTANVDTVVNSYGGVVASINDPSSPHSLNNTLVANTNIIAASIDMKAALIDLLYAYPLRLTKKQRLARLAAIKAIDKSEGFGL